MSTESSFDWSQPVPRLSGYDFSRKPRWQGHWGGYLSGYNARYFLEYDHPAGTARLWVFCQPIFGTRGWYGEGPASYDPASSSIRFSVQGIRHDPRSGQPLTLLRCTGEAKDMPDHVGLKLNPSEKPLSERRLTNPPPTQTSTPTVVTPPPPPPKPPAPPQAKQPTQPSSKPSPQATATAIAPPPPQASQATQPLQRVWPKPRHFVGQIAGRVPIHLELDRPFGDKVTGYSSSTWEKGEGSFDLVGRITPGGVLNLVAYSGKQPVRKLVGSIQGDRGDRLVADWLELDRNGRVVRSRELVAVYAPAPSALKEQEQPNSRQLSYKEKTDVRSDNPHELVTLASKGAMLNRAELQIVLNASNSQALRLLLRKKSLSTQEILEARKLIDGEPPSIKGLLFLLLQYKVPYHNQRDNEITTNRNNLDEARGDVAAQKFDRIRKIGDPIGDIMCQLTAAAMALEMLGIGRPTTSEYKQFEDYLEQLRRDRKLPHRTEWAGWGGVIKAMGAKVTKLEVGSSKDKWIKEVLPHLKKGDAIMMSIHGHIVRVQNVLEDGISVDDPFGGGIFVGYDKKGNQYWDWSDYNDWRVGKESGAMGEDNLWSWSFLKERGVFWVAAISKG